MSDINQDDIDKLLQDALAGGDAPATPEPAAEPAPEEDRGAASQDDIDALFAAVGSDAEPAPAAPKPAPAPKAAAEPPPAAEPEPEPELEGVASQDDIDALFSMVGGDDLPEASAPAAEPEAPAEESDLDGIASNDDIDALFSAVGLGNAPAETTDDTDTVDRSSETVFEEAPAGQTSDGDFESQLAEAEAAADEEEAAADSDLDELLSSIAGEGSTADAAHDGSKDETVRVDDVDMEELLRQVSDAAPPPPPPKPHSEPRLPDLGSELPGADTAILDMTTDDINQALAQAEHARPQTPAPKASTTTTPVAAYAPPPPPPPPPAAPGQRKEFSVLYGAGEVESVAGQISALISSLTEKAHGYMQAWIAADSEAKELRARALAEERRRTSLESEKAALAGQTAELRSRLGELEGGKLANEESRRTLETSFQAKIRELESQVSMFSTEAEGLKNELTRVRNQATGVDIESRRARFEVDRLKNEVESERMERLRIQRALENREKELQAMQAQSSGQASSLFIDELHRLVRRLESELDARSSGAHEALKQLDRLSVGEDMVPVAANIRASLMQAIGADSDQDDAIRSLGREASGIKGPAAVAPGKTEMVSFETALSTYNLSSAIDVAGALLREAKGTPGTLMRKIYLCPALRRPEVAPNLDDLSRLLEGLRTVQESGDRSRGAETAESEMFYVHMFDFLHNLVRLKLVTRLSGEIWRLFLDLRGRFSFVTSDKQWAEYRDQTLNDKTPKA